MSWLIVGLLGLAFLSGLVVFIRKRRARPSADDTLVADLLGPPELPEFPAPRTWDDAPHSPGLRAQKDGQPGRARRARKDRWPPRAAGRSSPNPRAREDGQPAPAPGRAAPAADGPSPALRVGEDGQPAPAASRQSSPAPGRPSPAAHAQEDDAPPPVPSSPPVASEDWLETQLAWINAWSQRMKEQITSAEQPERQSKE